MKIKDKRREKESYPQWVVRLLPRLSEKEQKVVCDMIKEAWFDGLRYERRNCKAALHEQN